MDEKKIRITKAQRFEDIKALLTDGEVKYGTTIEVAITVIDHELELLRKKNSSSDNKNENFKEQIMEYLADLDADTDGVTCTEIFKAIPDLTAYSSQKVAALVRQLKLDGRVVCMEKKGKSLFKMA